MIKRFLSGVLILLLTFFIGFAAVETANANPPPKAEKAQNVPSMHVTLNDNFRPNFVVQAQSPPATADHYATLTRKQPKYGRVFNGLKINYVQLE